MYEHENDILVVLSSFRVDWGKRAILKLYTFLHRHWILSLGRAGIEPPVVEITHFQRSPPRSAEHTFIHCWTFKNLIVNYHAYGIHTFTCNLDWSSGEKSYKFEEFIPVYKELINEKDTGTFADFMEAFKTFDREGQGFISGAELRHVLSSLGRQLHWNVPL